MYQANYGFTATGEHDPNINVESEDESVPEKKNTDKEKSNDSQGKKRKQEEHAWFDIDQKTNNNVYVSGLPSTTTEEDFLALMTKCGIIMVDDTGTYFYFFNILFLNTIIYLFILSLRVHNNLLCREMVYVVSNPSKFL